jgi:hypothetical protein
MMKKRDLEIIISLEKFKCLTRDQIAALHFSKNARPHISANQVLKRLRRDNYITANTDRSFQQYIYFNNPSPIKIDSQKINHHLLINQTIIDMLAYSPINSFTLETKLPDTDLIPDINVKGWLGKDWFIECQNSLYTVKQLYSKIDKYKDYYDKGYWNDERVIIIGKINLKFDSNDYPFKIMQIKEIDELKETIQKFKEIKLNEFKEKKGIKYVPKSG